MVTKFCAGQLRAITSIAVAGVLVVGCAGSAATNDASLSPAENQLRQSTARFNKTVGEGAVAGAALGGVAGLAFGGHNRGQAALVGAAAGGALGAGAGYLVASNNLSRSSTEAQFSDAIQQSNAQAAQFSKDAALSRQIADEATAASTRLGAQYHAHEITQAQYQTGMSRYQIDSNKMSEQASEARKAAAEARRGAQVASGKDKTELMKSAISFDRSASDNEQSAVAISRAIAAQA